MATTTCGATRRPPASPGLTPTERRPFIGPRRPTPRGTGAPSKRVALSHWHCTVAAQFVQHSHRTVTGESVTVTSQSQHSTVTVNECVFIISRSTLHSRHDCLTASQVAGAALRGRRHGGAQAARAAGPVGVLQWGGGHGREVQVDPRLTALGYIA